MKVLLVEDAEGMRGLVTTMLKSMGVTDVIQTKHWVTGQPYGIGSPAGGRHRIWRAE
jgi:hypothetical protein